VICLMVGVMVVGGCIHSGCWCLRYYVAAVDFVLFPIVVLVVVVVSHVMISLVTTCR
jgi:hypothetical protein